MNVAQYRDPMLAQKLAGRLRSLDLPRRIRIMEVCGGHTAAIYRYALHALLPDTIELLSGPGCPVCVTPNEYIDRAIAIADSHHVVLASFGDLLRVPGSHESLSQARARGCDVRVYYSSAEALDFAETQPQRNVVFLGIGFETTACTIAATMRRAIEHNVRNFKLLSAMKTMPNALRALLSSPDIRVDGLLLPGHVTAITGTSVFEFLPRDLGVACTVSGFEPLDILESIDSLAGQILAKAPRLENGYRRAVHSAGNASAQRAMRELFCETDVTWRGLGAIPQSGLTLRSEFAEWDAAQYRIAAQHGHEHPACRCGDILRGHTRPQECPLFGTACTPESPLGACMVSSEGACAAVYQFANTHEARELHHA